MLRSSYLAAFCALLCSLSTISTAQEKFATTAEFKSAIIGKTISSNTSKGQPFTAVIKAGGTGDFQISGKPAEKFKWKFTGNTFCWTFPYLTECSHVEITGATAANFIDAKTGKLNNAYVVADSVLQ